METKTSYKGKLTKYFSEIKELKIIKKLDMNSYSFKIFIGGKGKGKSHFAFEEMIRHIKLGNIVGYLRNSEVEIKQIKSQIAQMIVNQTSYQNISVSNENIVDKDSKKVLVVFISTKNYNKLSGNETPFGMIFYDEFNQDLGSRQSEMIMDFFNILQTAFRNKKWNVWACGNTKTRNNVIYNLFKLDLLDIEDNLEVIDIDKAILIIRYKDELFKELNMDSQDLELIKKYNRLAYDTMMKGISYEREDELVLNNVDDLIKNLVYKQEIIIYKNRVYELFSDKQNQYYFWIRNEEVKGSIEFINQMTKAGFNVYEIELDYYNLSNNIKKYYESLLSLEMGKLLRQQRVFFNDYPLYLVFKESPFITMYNDFKPLTK